MSITPEHAADLDQLKRALGAIQKLRTRIDGLESAAHEPIAIVGIGCRLPGGANSPEALWNLLRDGIEAVDDVPADRWDAEAYYDPQPGAPGKLPTRRAGFIGDVDQFDARFFGISPREARAMDPQQRLILEATWEALEDAGIAPDRLAGSQTGVFIGIGLNDYGRLQTLGQASDPSLADLYALSGNCLCIAANRVSYLLDLRGPSMAIDTACSSSLVAIHQAVQSLRRGESALALAGGVNLLLVPETGVSLSRLLSPDGRTKFGDAGANGFVRGEGAAVIVLKRLSSAVADGDPVYAVIRGSAVNQDGFSSGLTVPNGVAQQALLREALRDAGVHQRQIDYVEAHGTGTSLGDPIEIQALGAVLGAGRDPSQPLLIGSIKTNIGHLEAGAGIAGLLKATLAIAAGEIPPSLHYERPNPNIHFEQLGVRVQTSLMPWPDGDRIAGVSSFGFGGANAHVILQAAPLPAESPVDERRAAQLLLLSAKSVPALRDLAGRYASWLDDHPETSLADLCHVAAIGRTHHDYRTALPAASNDELRTALRATADGALPGGVNDAPVVPGVHPKVAFLFTGQGAQYAGMGRGLYDIEPAFRDALDRCAALLEPHLNRPLLEVMFAAPDSPEAELLHRTEYTQPALFALEYALAELWQSWGVRPAAVAGHSVGELVAACVAGVFSLEDGLRLVAARGRLMGELPAGGTMAAIFATEARVRDAILPHAGCLSVAAVNEPGHVVISGDEAAVVAVAEAFEADDVRVRRLVVSHAFHSPLMDPILDKFEALARNFSYGAAKIPLVANLTGRLWAAGDTPDAGYWRRHLREAVQFAQCLHSLHDIGCEVFIEIGPGPALSGMGGGTLPETVTFTPSLRAGDDRQILKSLGVLYRRDVAVDWIAINGRRPRRHLSLPAYPWQRERYWIEQSPSGSEHRPASPNRIHPLIDRELRSPALRDTVFEANVGRARLPFLDGHRAYGAMIFPAAAFLELAVAAGGTLDSRDLDVEEMTINEALVIPEEGDRLVQTILRRDGEALRFEVNGLEEDGNWHCHVTGRLAPAGELVLLPTLADARAACLDEVASDVIYERFKALGMQYGPSFRGIARLWRGHDAALGVINLPAEAGDPTGYRMHPALLDACLQVVGSLFSTDEDATYLPIDVEGYAVHDRPGTTLWCHIRSLPGGDSSTLICSVDIFDSEGSAVATIARVTLRRAPRHALAAVLGDRDETALLYDLIWREAPRESTATPSIGGRWLIFADAGGIGEQLARSLEARGEQADLVWPGDAFTHGGPGHWRVDPADATSFRRLLREIGDDPPVSGVVYLWSAVDGPMTEHIDATLSIGLQGALHLSQALAEDAQVPVWFVTRGAQAADSEITAPAQASIWGFARGLGREHPELRPICVDLDPGYDGNVVADLLWELDATDREDAVAFRDRKRLVARLVRGRVVDPEDQPVRLEITERGAFDGLTLRPLVRRCPGPGEVEILVHASGLNFRDVLNTLGLYPDPAGHPGNECAGIVTAVGEGVSDWKAGDVVVALAEDCFGTYALAPAALTARLPAGLSFAEAATLPIAFVTASYSLRHLARIQSGTRVLIHAATGGVGSAALQIARTAGAEIFATAGSDEKRAVLRSMGVQHVYDSRSRGFADAIRSVTGGGVDVVLNSLTGDLIPESLDALRDGGCFLEIGKLGIWPTEKVAALGRGIDYHVIYMGEVYERDPELARDLLRGTCAAVETGELTALPLRSFPLARGVEAFRFMGLTRHIGKVVITQEHRAPLKVAQVVCRDASYLVTGGLGGLGLTVARWLIEHGARSLVLVGRRAPSQAARASLAELERSGARVLVLQADIGQRTDVARVLAAIDDGMPPLAGVIHAAGVLDDGVLAQQTWERFTAVLAPKLGGAWHLHDLTKERPLDFFVLFSAGAALIGTSGQTNYVAANAAVDALAHWRRAHGLPALSINWGPWAEVGMAAELGEEHRRRLARQGLHSLTPEEGLRGLEAALAAGPAQVAVLPTDWGAFGRQFAPQAPPSLFRDLVKASRENTANPNEAADGDIASRLAETPPSLRRSALLRYLREQAAHVLGVATADALPAGRPLSELGLDSLMAVDLRNVLRRALGLALPATLIFDHPTPDALADYLLPMLAGASEDAPRRDRVAATVRTDDEIDLAALSDEEAEALLRVELSLR